MCTLMAKTSCLITGWAVHQWRPWWGSCHQSTHKAGHMRYTYSLLLTGWHTAYHVPKFSGSVDNGDSVMLHWLSHHAGACAGEQNSMKKTDIKQYTHNQAFLAVCLSPVKRWSFCDLNLINFCVTLSSPVKWDIFQSCQCRATYFTSNDTHYFTHITCRTKHDRHMSMVYQARLVLEENSCKYNVAAMWMLVILLPWHGPYQDQGHIFLVVNIKL